MANFSFYFTLNKVNLNKEKNILELIIGSTGFQGITSFPANENNIDIITEFWLLELPVNSDNKQLFLIPEAIGKEFIILNIHEKALENSTIFYAFHSDERKFQSKFTIKEGSYSQIRKLLPSEKKPSLNWDDFEKPNNERRNVGWQILWNPIDGKLWDPPLEDWEKNKFFENNKLANQRIARDIIYKGRINGLKKKFNLYFTYHGLQIVPSRFPKSIKIFCDLMVPNKLIREFIMWDDKKQEFDNSLIGEIEIIFDEKSNESMIIFEKLKELLGRGRKGDKFSLRNIPLLYDTWGNFPTGFIIYNFDNTNYNEWKSITKLNTEFTKQKNPNSSSDDLLYDGKIVKRWEITTTGWEKQLKFEKVSEEEYKANVENPFLEQNSNDNYKKLFYLFSATTILLLGIFVFRWIKKRKNYKNI